MKTIKVNEIKCEFDRKTTEKEIQARAESINGIGLIHSVKIQSIEGETFKYQVVAGRKSFAALTKIIGKTELQIPDEVSFIEGDADIIAFAENDERTNLSLAEQVEKLAVLSEKFGIAELASHLSHSPQWIAARIRLKELSESWQKAMKENRFEQFIIGHYEAIAKYPQEIQDDIFEYCTSWNFDADISLAKFAKELETNFTFQIKNAPWNDGSYQGCGECPACIDRLNGGFLFEEMNNSDKGICQNRQFYIDKLNEFIAERVEESRKSEPEILLVSQDNRYPEGFPIDDDEIYPDWAWEKTTKKEGGQKALVVNGPLTGKIIFVSIAETYNNLQNQDEVQGEEKPQKKVSTLAERKERKHRQRQRHAIFTLMEYIEAMEYEIPDRDTIFKFIACLGVNSIFSYSYNEEHQETGTGGIVAYETVSEHSELDKAVWRKLITNIIGDLKQGQSGPVEARWQEAEIISRIICFDLKKALEVAVETLPDPKAWEKLEKQEKKAA